MHRKDLLDKLNAYSPEHTAEKVFRADFLSFIEQNADCFERTLQKGHVTGSAWVINADFTQVLLTHHRKLNKWLQPGGHADGNNDIVAVATAEAREETGLQSLQLRSNDIFDIDIHIIPARKNEPEHLHYDVRFLFTADRGEAPIVSEESNKLSWFPLYDLQKITNNESMHRMAVKTLSQWV